MIEILITFLIILLFGIAAGVLFFILEIIINKYIPKITQTKIINFITKYI